jgi:hypothetical protein
MMMLIIISIALAHRFVISPAILYGCKTYSYNLKEEGRYGGNLGIITQGSYKQKN